MKGSLCEWYERTRVQTDIDGSNGMKAGIKLAPRAVLSQTFGTKSSIPEPGRRATSVSERADVGCVLLTAATDLDPGTNEAIRHLQLKLPDAAGVIVTDGSRRALWLSPRSWLIQCGVADDTTLITSVNSLGPERLLHAVCFTDALCWFELSGAGAQDLLTEGGFLSLERAGIPVGFSKRTLIAQINVIVVREDLTTWMVGVERSRAGYFSEWLRAAAELN